MFTDIKYPQKGYLGGLFHRPPKIFNRPVEEPTDHPTVRDFDAGAPLAASEDWRGGGCFLSAVNTTVLHTFFIQVQNLVQVVKSVSLFPNKFVLSMI